MESLGENSPCRGRGQDKPPHQATLAHRIPGWEVLQSPPRDVRGLTRTSQEPRRLLSRSRSLSLFGKVSCWFCLSSHPVLSHQGNDAGGGPGFPQEGVFQEFICRGSLGRVSDEQAVEEALQGRRDLQGKKTARMGGAGGRRTFFARPEPHQDEGDKWQGSPNTSQTLLKEKQMPPFTFPSPSPASFLCSLHASAPGGRTCLLSLDKAPGTPTTWVLPRGAAYSVLGGQPLSIPAPDPTPLG